MKRTLLLSLALTTACGQNLIKTARQADEQAALAYRACEREPSTCAKAGTCVERALALIGAVKRQLAKPPAQRIGDVTVPKLKQETEQACKL
jgi:hypothetical protein